MGKSFVEYSAALTESMTSEVRLSGLDKQSFELLFSVLALNFANRGHFSPAEVVIASSEGLKSARDLDDALSANQNNTTRFAVGSWRVFAKNHDYENIVTGSDLPSELTDRKLQVRFLQSWLGDHNGEAEEKVARLRSLMKANQNMQGQVRERFAMIDTRKVAVERLKKAEWQLDKMPIERVVMQLEERRKTIGPISRVNPETFSSLVEIDILHTLGGDDDLIVRDSVGKVAWEQKLRNMRSESLLSELPERVEKAYKHFGR